MYTELESAIIRIQEEMYHFKLFDATCPVSDIQSKHAQISEQASIMYYDFFFSSLLLVFIQFKGCTMKQSSPFFQMSWDTNYSINQKPLGI